MNFYVAFLGKWEKRKCQGMDLLFHLTFYPLFMVESGFKAEQLNMSHKRKSRGKSESLLSDSSSTLSQIKQRDAEVSCDIKNLTLRV
jgi:hypothetical protein